MSRILKTSASLLLGSLLAMTLTFVGSQKSAKAWDSNCYNPPVTQREVNWLGVSWFGYQDSNLNSNFVTSSNFLSWRYFAAAGSSGSEIQIKLDGGSFVSMPYPCGALSYTGLSEGVHTLRIEQNLGSSFGWCASWVWSNCTDRTFYVDSTPPPSFVTNSPVLNAVVASNPQFQWDTTTDATSGTKSYALFIDGVSVITVDQSSCTNTCSALSPALLADGDHSYYVVATDGAGLTRTTSTVQFEVRDSPTAALSHTPLQGLTGKAVTLQAGASAIANNGALTYDWDLDGNGSFETSTGVVANASVTFSTRGTKSVSVRTTSVGGATSTASNSVEVFQSPPGGEIGLTINDGANYTTTKTVGLNLVWPEYASTVRISNDGGFKANMTQAFDIDTPISWALDDSANGVYTKIVYIRFDGTNLDSTRTYSDDIIFDNRPPAVASTNVDVVGDYFSISLLATDVESGISTVDIGNESNFVTSPYATSILTKITEVDVSVNSSSVKKSSVGGLKIRVSDKAGNKTSWIVVKATTISPTVTTIAPTVATIAPTVATIAPTVATVAPTTTTVVPVRTSISRREISTPTQIASMVKLSTNSAKKFSLKVNASGAKTCMMVGLSVIGLKRGTCSLTLSMIPRKGKTTSKQFKIRVS
jgi:hypothetical protein